MTPLIDGDIVAYLACESRVKGLNIADHIKLEAGIDYSELKLVTLDPIEYTPAQNVAYMEKAWNHFLKITQDVCEVAFSKKYLMAVAGDNNFREIIYPAYKANRRVAKRNEFVPKLRERAVESNVAIFAHGMETDDQIRIWHHDLTSKGEDVLIAGGDKDFKCMWGKHLTIKTNATFYMTPEAAMKFFYAQLMIGDSTDNIKGVPGVGPVTANGLIEPCETEQEMQATVIKCYQAAFGKDDWRNELILNGRLIHLLRTPDDVFNIDGWPEVEYEDRLAPPEKLVPVIPKDMPEFVYAPSAIPPPVFNPNWGKKK